MPSAKTKRASAKQWYATRKEVCREYYATNVRKLQSWHMRLKVIPKKKLKTLIQKSLEASKKAYVTDPDRYNSYNANPKNKSEAAKKAYKENAENCKEASKHYYSEHRKEICSKKMGEYTLRQPNKGCIKFYVEGLFREFMRNPELKLCLTLV